MKRNRFRRSVKDRLISPVEDQTTDEHLGETGSYEVSASYFEGLGRYKTKFRKEEILIVVGLYLLLASVAFVVL